MLLGSGQIKFVHKHVGEIDPRCQFHQHFTCAFFIRVTVWLCIFFGARMNIGTKIAHKMLVKLIIENRFDGYKLPELPRLFHRVRFLSPRQSPTGLDQTTAKLKIVQNKETVRRV